eukprot:scaffold19382_cov75-Phaeocystis_antarctica.AAC.4
MSRVRLANLSYAQLLEIAVDAYESSPELKNKADALIAKVAPLPSRFVDVLLSPDLLPQLFSSLGLSEHAAAGVCTTWSHAYSRQLRRCRYVDPRIVRQLADVPTSPNGLCMLPGGVLAIASCEDYGQAAVKFVAARSDSDPQALASCRASSLAARRFAWLMGLAHTNDGLLVCNVESSAALYKFAKDGLMDELATMPALTDYKQGFNRCAVHQQTQRTYAIAQAGDGEGRNALVVLDANLQVIAMIEVIEATDNGYGAIIDVAVHGDQVIVLTSNHHPEGSGLRLLDLDGRFLRTIAAGQFINPQAVAASHGRAFVIDDDDDNKEPDTVLHIIDIQSGRNLQSVPLPLGLGGHDNGTIIVDGDEIYIADFRVNEVAVLRIAGSEA